MTVFGKPAVLAVAGVDPTGGAGLFADFDTFETFGVRGLGVVAALTAQTDRSFTGAYPIGETVVRAELDAVCEGETIAAVKVGMLGDADNVIALAEAIRRYRLPNVVIDPVLQSSSGGQLLTPDGVVALGAHLLPLATIITPNTTEAGALLGRAAPRDLAGMHAAARDLLRFGSTWVLVTGGHADGADCVDVLANLDGTMELAVARVDGSIRGSGCRLSSAIAAGLASGMSVADACARAQEYVASRIQRSMPPRLIMEIA